MMGDKAKARQTAVAAGVPVLPGSQRAARVRRGGARSWRRRIGYPVILKAAAGGGGRGMRIVRSDGRDRGPVRDRVATRRSTAFGDGSIYLEKYLEEPRHIEFQVFGDRLRQRHPPGRARVLDPAPPPEADRGVALAGAHARSSATRMGEAAVKLCARGRLPERRHDRVPARPGRQLLLHGDEHPHPGRAPGDRDGDRRRPGEAADPRRRGRAADHPHRPQAARPRDRVPHQRRGSGDLRALARQADDLPPARRPGRARRHARLRGLLHPAELRFAGGEADRPRRARARRRWRA